MNTYHNLVKLRKEKNLTQEDVSKLLSISSNAYSQKERGDTPFKIEEMQQLSKIFNKKMDYIFFRENVAK